MSRRTVAAFPRRLRDNPYCERLYAALEAVGVPVESQACFGARWLWRQRRSVAVLHVHWPEALYRDIDGRVSVRSAAGFVLALLVARVLRYRLVWTMHNALPHERRRVDVPMRWLLVRLARVVVHDLAARAALPSGVAPAAIIPHGHYVGAYPDDVSRAEARRRLGLRAADRVFLCLGQIRPYKGLPELVRAFRALPGVRLRLLIAGRPVDQTTVRAVRAAAWGDRRVRLHAQFVPDDQVQVFLRAADFVVLPYRDVLTSGAAMLALSFGRALVVPRRGSLPALAEAGAALVYEPDEPDGLRRALAAAAQADAGWLGARGRALALANDWDAIARAYADVYGLPAAPPVPAPQTVCVPECAKG